MTTRTSKLDILHRKIVRCRACPRLVAWRETVAHEKRARYRDETYWGRPVPGFGDPRASIVVVGLAPGAHGANRTGRAFTGDRSGDFLFAALHRAGLANQPTSIAKDDGLVLDDVFISLAVRCVPPDNKPSPAEIARCAPYLHRELDALARPRVLLALGRIAWDASLTWLAAAGADATLTKRRPAFAHGRVVDPSARGAAPTAQRLPAIVASYHVSQQNTQTGRLTPAMFDAVLRSCRDLAAARQTREPLERRRRGRA